MLEAADMKRRVKIVGIFIVFWVSLCCSGYKGDVPAENKTKEFYLRFSPATDPGEFAPLFQNLPQSLEELNALIKKLVIHPLEAREMEGVLPEGRTSEDQNLPTVKDMLRELLHRHSGGLSVSRKPAERLVVACYHHALLLTSILRSRGIPVRMRTGFARYFEKETGVRFGHVICEVWDLRRGRWILVDPDRQMVNFSENSFDFGFQAWFHLRRGTFDTQRYISTKGGGLPGVLHIFCQDISGVLGEEKFYWQEPPIFEENLSTIGKMGREKIEVMDRIAELMDSPDIDVAAIEKIKKSHDFLNLK
jgi:hypothetical protein